MVKQSKSKLGIWKFFKPAWVKMMYLHLWKCFCTNTPMFLMLFKTHLSHGWRSPTAKGQWAFRCHPIPLRQINFSTSSCFLQKWFSNPHQLATVSPWRNLHCFVLGCHKGEFTEHTGNAFFENISFPHSGLFSHEKVDITNDILFSLCCVLFFNLGTPFLEMF